MKPFVIQTLAGLRPRETAVPHAATNSVTHEDVRQTRRTVGGATVDIVQRGRQIRTVVIRGRDVFLMGKNIDPREVPAYSIRDAAHYLRLPVETLRSWVKGRTYSTRDGIQKFKPVIALPDAAVPTLSFTNLAEAHVLSAFRRDYRIPFKRIRAALAYVSKEFGWDHPLIQQEFETDGITLFIEKLGHWVDASARGQIVTDSVKEFFLRLDRSADSGVIRLWPFTRDEIRNAPRKVFIDPTVSFGRPSLAGCRVPTAVIAERYRAGESVDDLADDYGCPRLDIEEGLRCEFEFRAAA